jgi:sugar O-acyltransferase (sialic acid O-acetyltransferase NeuD family)
MRLMPLLPESGRRQRIVIFGTGTGADLARRCFESDTPHEIVAYVVDREHLSAGNFRGCPVVAIDELARTLPPSDVVAFAPLGSGRMNGLRSEKYKLLKSMGYGFATYVHSSNRLAGRCIVGENCLILENQSVNFDTVIGDNVVIWSGCQIGDRSRIGNNVFMASHVVINGDVQIGENAYLGSNCNISNGVRVAPLSFVGANALITTDTKQGSVHVVEPTPALGIDSLRFTRLIRDFM